MLRSGPLRRLDRLLAVGHRRTASGLVLLARFAMHTKHDLKNTQVVGRVGSRRIGLPTPEECGAISGTQMPRSNSAIEVSQGQGHPAFVGDGLECWMGLVQRHGTVLGVSAIH
jgi:hypothetical protein